MEQTIYIFEHIESGKWIDFDSAKLTTSFEKAMYFKNKEWAEKWIQPLTKDEEELKKLGFAPLFMNGLKNELQKKGIDLYKDFIIAEHQTKK